jgi:hypothetical protein
VSKENTVRRDRRAEALPRDSAGEHCRNEALEPGIEDASISALIDFFKLLDKWDQEAKRQ